MKNNHCDDFTKRLKFSDIEDDNKLLGFMNEIFNHSKELKKIPDQYFEEWEFMQGLWNIWIKKCETLHKQVNDLLSQILRKASGSTQ